MTETNVTRTIRPNWCFIRLNEHMEHWNLPDAIKPYVAAIYGVYAFDRNLHTHCCEVTPSYYLHCMDWDWDFTPAANLLPDAERSAKMDAISEFFFGDCHTYLEGCSGYHHAHHIEAMIQHDKTVRFHQAGDIDPDGEHADDEEGMLAEYWHPNPKF